MDLDKEEEKDPEKEDSNSCIHIYLQGHSQTLAECICFQLVETIFDEEMYDQLRNKEQLGYMVAAEKKVTNGVNGISMYIRSASYDPCYLEQRIYSFLV